MALTDWNQIEVSNEWIDFHNLKRYSTEITIQYHHFDKKYIVYIYGGKIPKQKSFKLKSQAINYAKSYMKTH